MVTDHGNVSLWSIPQPFATESGPFCECVLLIGESIGFDIPLRILVKQGKVQKFILAKFLFDDFRCATS